MMHADSSAPAALGFERTREDAAKLNEMVARFVAVRLELERLRAAQRPRPSRELSAVQSHVDRARVLLTALSHAEGADYAALMREYTSAWAVVERELAVAAKRAPTRLALRKSALAGNWAFVMAAGVAALTFGVLALLPPTLTRLEVSRLFSAYVVAAGASRIGAALFGRARRELNYALIASGVVYVALFASSSAALTAVGLLLTGALDFVVGRRLAGNARTLISVHGVVWALYGVVALVAPSSVSPALIFGGAAVPAGIMMCALALELRAAYLK